MFLIFFTSCHKNKRKLWTKVALGKQLRRRLLLFYPGPLVKCFILLCPCVHLQLSVFPWGSRSAKSFWVTLVGIFFNFHAQKKGQCLVGKEFYRLPAHDYFVRFFSRFSEHHLYNYRPYEIPLGPVTIFSCPELNDSWAVVTREFKFQFMHRPYNKSWMNDAGDVTHLEALRVKNFAARTLCSTTHTTIHSY